MNESVVGGPAAPGLRLAGRLAAGSRELVPAFEIELQAGRWHALVGPSGSGKSSLLRSIAGLAGPVRLEGQCEAQDGLPLPPRVAWMAQSDLLAPWLTVLGNVLLTDRLQGRPPQRVRAMQMLDAVGLAGRADDRPASLSGGMRQRVALARTLMTGRPLVLLDEPFSALDAGTRARMQDLAVQVLRGFTVVIVTHDPAEAVRVADTIHLVSAGGVRPLPVPPGRPVRALDAPAVQEAYGRLWKQLHEMAA